MMNVMNVLIFTVCRGHNHHLHSITKLPTYIRINTSNNSRQQYSRSCAAPAVYVSPHQKSLSSKGSANLIAFYHLASISFGVLANSMPEASLSVRSTNIYCFMFNFDGHQWLGLMYFSSISLSIVDTNIFLSIIFPSIPQGCNNSMSASKQKQKTTSS